MTGLSYIQLAANPIERWNYARNFSSRLMHSTWFWSVLCVTFAVVVVVYVVGRLMRRRSPVRKVDPFAAHAARVELNADEVKLLKMIAALAGLKRPEAVFVSEGAFDQGLRQLLASPRVAQMPPPMRQRTCELLGLLRERLGFAKSANSAEEAPASTRQIEPGQAVAVIGHGGEGELGATVARQTKTGLVLALEDQGHVAVGDVWIVRYSDGRATWEFQSPVVAAEASEVTLAHAEHLRFVNRRRFPRVPIDRPARLAVLTFQQDGKLDRAVQFVDAALTEIAGPGIVLRSPLEASFNQRVLVVMEIEHGQIVQAVGKVRRVDAREGQTLLAVELVGLTSSEIAELSRWTTEAARRQQISQDESDQSDEKPQPAPQAKWRSPDQAVAARDET